MSPWSSLICCHRDTTKIVVLFLDPVLKRNSAILWSSIYMTKPVSSPAVSNWGKNNIKLFLKMQMSTSLFTPENYNI